MPRKAKEVDQERLEANPEDSNQPEAQELTFRLERLRERSQDLFGVPVEIFDGAMYGFSQTNVTKSEVTKRIRDFLSREV